MEGHRGVMKMERGPGRGGHRVFRRVWKRVRIWEVFKGVCLALGWI